MKKQTCIYLKLNVINVDIGWTNEEFRFYKSNQMEDKIMVSKNDEMLFKMLKNPEKNVVISSKNGMPFVSERCLIIIL